MKQISSLIICLLLCFTATAFAGDNDKRAQQNLFELEPLYTRNARNVQRFTLNLNYDKFTNVRMEEAKEFDGYTTKIEGIFPFGADKQWEVRLEIPFYTKGDAWGIKAQQEIDIDGKGGVFDFANLVVQRELSTADKCPVNTSVYFGYGRRTAELETSIKDMYNHRGHQVRLGFNVDNARADRDIRLQASFDGRYYFDTDDLNPSDDGVNFYLMNLSGGAVYNADSFVKPAFEVLYSTDFGDRQIIQAVPQVIIPIKDIAEIKGGYAFGHSAGEGSTQTATVRATFKF